MHDLGFFQGIKQLYSPQFVDFIHKKHVMIIGIGGVGSWIAEALARSGVGEISLVDMDEICSSNVNRQIHAIDTTIAKPKVQVMGQRIKQINPNAKTHQIMDFYTKDTSDEILENDPDLVIDAIDSLQAKCHLLAACKQKNIEIICCGSAGGRVNPEKIKVKDLNKTINDRLLFRVRKKLRKDFEFPRTRKPYGITTVYSEELIELDEDAKNVERKLNCNGALGSATFVTATFGMHASAQAMKYFWQEFNYDN